MRKVFSFLGGMMVGAFTGGLLALLLAPETGPELQQQIRDYVDQLVNEGKDAARQRRLELEQQLEAFKKGKPASSTEST
jgi:gas vesicle protein